MLSRAEGYHSHGLFPHVLHALLINCMLTIQCSSAAHYGRLSMSMADCISVVGNGENKFRIDSLTGKIYAESLDREKQERYTLTVQAKDHGKQSRSNTTQVIITVSCLPLYAFCWLQLSSRGKFYL